MGPDVAVPIFFFLAVFGIVAMTLWRRLMAERERQQTIRLAIERGQALDAALVEKMMAPPAKAPHNPFTFPLAFLSAGIGLGVLGLFMRQLAEEAFWPIAGSGCMVAIIGAGLLIAEYLRSRLLGNGSRSGSNG